MRGFLPVLTDVKSLCYIAERLRRVDIFVLICNEFSNASHHSVGNRKPFCQTRYVAGAAEEHGLTERDAREQTLQVHESGNGEITRTKIYVWYTYLRGGNVNIKM